MYVLTIKYFQEVNWFKAVQNVPAYPPLSYLIKVRRVKPATT